MCIDIISERRSNLRWFSQVGWLHCFLVSISKSRRRTSTWVVFRVEKTSSGRTVEDRNLTVNGRNLWTLLSKLSWYLRKKCLVSHETTTVVRNYCKRILPFRRLRPSVSKSDRRLGTLDGSLWRVRGLLQRVLDSTSRTPGVDQQSSGLTFLRNSVWTLS